MLTDELVYWGQGSLQTKLDEAYKDFVGYCRVHKLCHSQPPFKVKMDSLKHRNFLLDVLQLQVCRYKPIFGSYQVSTFFRPWKMLWTLNILVQLLHNVFLTDDTVILSTCAKMCACSTKLVFVDIFRTLKIGCWRRCPSKVRKSSGEVLLTAKAWNGRVIAQWLAETISIATAGFDVFHGEGRYTLACHAATCACIFYVWFNYAVSFLYAAPMYIYAWYSWYVYTPKSQDAISYEVVVRVKATCLIYSRDPSLMQSSHA